MTLSYATHNLKLA